MEISLFSLENFAGVKPLNTKLVKRLHVIATRLSTTSAKSLPQRMPKAEYEGLLRFVNHPRTTHEVMLQTHRKNVSNAIAAASGDVLILHDTTVLDYSNPLCAETMGPVGNGGGRGYMCHNSLAVDAENGHVIGLAHQILHTRPNEKRAAGTKIGRDDPGRESLLWLKACQEIGSPPPGKTVIHVADRGADTFEFLQYQQESGQHFVIRSAHNRVIAADPAALVEHGKRLNRRRPADRTPEIETMDFERLESDSWATAASDAGMTAAPRPRAVKNSKSPASIASESLDGDAVSDGISLMHDRLRQRPAMARWSVRVGSARGREPRLAEVSAAWDEGFIGSPHKMRGKNRRDGVKVRCLRIWEPWPPAGEERLEWFLLTDLEVSGPEQARRVAGHYERRWVIEEYHKCLKSGLGIEDLQFRTASAIDVMIGILSVVGVELLRLRDLSRDPEQVNRPAIEVVDELAIEVLEVASKADRPIVTIGDYVTRLARLGGWLSRAKGARPGWIVLWRGQVKLMELLDYERAREKARTRIRNRSSPEM